MCLAIGPDKELAPSWKIPISNASRCTNTVTQMETNVNDDAHNTTAILTEKPREWRSLTNSVNVAKKLLTATNEEKEYKLFFLRPGDIEYTYL